MTEKHFNFIFKHVTHRILMRCNLSSQWCTRGWYSSSECWGLVWDKAFIGRWKWHLWNLWHPKTGVPST